MNHLFVPYQEALELKELGFDEQCLAHYVFRTNTSGKGEVFLHIGKLDYDDIYLEYKQENIPLYSQAFDWFREKHSLYSYIEPVIVEHAASPIKFDYVILELNISEEIIFDTLPFHSNEKAQLACLQKLIEICKDDNTTRS